MLGTPGAEPSVYLTRGVRSLADFL